MASARTRHVQKYCSVYGCLNSSLRKAELSFFKLPADLKRRSEWLSLICRDDLINKRPKSYSVCEEHFSTEDILPGSHRKTLKQNSLPSIHLPQPNKKDLVARVERFTQTEEEIKNVINNSAQTSASLLSDTPLMRKLKLDLSECKKKIRFNETKKKQRDTFHKLCDRFLTKELAQLVKAQTDLKIHNKGNRYDQEYKIFCSNLFYSRPQVYRLLQSMLCLPCPNTLSKYSISFTTEINVRVISLLKTKVQSMTDTEKNCSVIIDAMSLKANLFYNTRADKIIGFHNVNGLQSPELAKNALVMMVHGIFVNWKQPVGYALLSECRNYEIAKWINKLLGKLFEIGLNIRTFISDLGSDLFNAAENRSVTIEKPYFFFNNKKIYYIFDTSHLIKSVRNNLLVYDFHFQGCVAKYEHIVQFYEHDKTKSCRLAQKLNSSHINPTNLEKMKLRYATQLLSNSVAAGISTYIDFNIIDESGRNTVEFIKLMNNLFDSLNSCHLRDDYEYKRAFRGTDSQVAFFNKMLGFFQNLKLINPENGHDVTSDVKFIQGFQTTIRSILLIFDDLQQEGYTVLLIRRLNQNVIKNFFRQIRTKNAMATDPTSRQFVSAFRKLIFPNIKLPKGGNCVDDLGQRYDETSRSKQTEISLASSTSDEDLEGYNKIKIMKSEYNQLDMLEKKSLFYICGYLLKKCAENHNDCQILNSYIKPHEIINNYSSDRRYLWYNVYSQDLNPEFSQNLLVVPCDDFILYVERMEEQFRSSFEKKHINRKIALSIFKEINKISFLPPCPCFPLIYLNKLFIRMRIFYTVKFNNRAFRVCRSGRKYFSVTNL